MSATVTTSTPVIIRPSTEPIDVTMLDAGSAAPELDAKHAAYLATRGVSPLVAQARGYFSCTPLPLPEDSPTTGPIQEFGWSRLQNEAFCEADPETGRYVRALVIPLYAGRDLYANVQVRLDSPRRVIDLEATKKANPVKLDADGIEVPVNKKHVTKFTSIKFEVPAFESWEAALPGANGQPTRRGSEDYMLPADIHPLAAGWVDDTTVPVLLTEGIPKADAVLSEALRTGVKLVPIALTGVTMGYRAAGSPENPSDNPVLVAETLGLIPWAGRTVYMAFDADWATNRMIKRALATTAALLTAQGASVSMVCVPATEADPKRGIDDFLAAARAGGAPAPLTELLNERTLNPAQAEALTRYYSADDVGRGDRFAAECLAEKDAVWNIDGKEWMRWNGSIWDRRATAPLLRRAMALTERDTDNQESYKAGRGVRALEAALKVGATHPDLAVNELDFDLEPNVLNVANGMVDLLTGNLKPHDRRLLQTKRSGTSYSPTAKAPRWEQFLGETFGQDAELIAYVQRAFGSALFGDVRDEFAIFCTGAGQNGKGVFIDAISFAMGNDFVVPLSPDILLGHPSDEQLAELHGKRLAIMQESNAGQQLDSAALKRIASKDAISARKLFKDRFSFRPSHTPVFITNHLPRVTEQDRGSWRRIKAVPFDNQVTEEAKDVNLPDTLQLEAEGILAWLVRGALAFREHGLGTAAAVERLTAAYRKSGDTLGQFLEEYCIVEPTANANRAITYRAFTAFCVESGIRPWSQRALVGALGERGVIDRMEPAHKNAGVWYWAGFKLNPEAPANAQFFKNF
ncbi:MULTISPECIES: phage/plasmid primase, P4 family [Cryobacterium]|uniref:DUF3854 domain-containing protein n=1 Tax=Cryobacterium glucosi TaxID=1259175 RepID=A0ABY2IR46_9MICO|nr:MULTISPECIES: phage/plasmid primase, P4 family [Cryobacterium]TFB99717.1 DUF3854 domain-containing protein [Cryobacterium sp. MDB2-A-1]TFC09700.1 DUF3854 domain-containing protein [Cryobacterium sp. MDB2-A-2]TFC22674.1 DUF3854 domain-containing protein [Cryobacterium glucosi]TFC23968.1 DUF3854 domain-containing protein [Cryobacterium sp. MDB2-10]